MPDARASRFPGYDVLAKRAGPSWNDKTRKVIEDRLAIGPDPLFFTPDEFSTVCAAADRIVPQQQGLPAIPVALLVDRKLHLGQSDGYRLRGSPRDGEAWRLGLKALDVEALNAFGNRFHALRPREQDTLLLRMQKAELRHSAWGPMKSDDF